MPTRTLPANKSSLFAGASTNLGGGADDHLPVGAWSGYQFRSAVRFALDFSNVKRINSAVLRLRTSTQVHVGFSATPDFVIRRATADWSANGSSSSAEGGSGWGTSPTVYPGPASTDTGSYTRRAPTAESTWVETNITGIVREWLDGQPNYGITLRPASSSDVIEFASYHAGSGRPEIVMDYAADTAPVATTTGPAGTVGTVRPTITATASDIDGDPITSYDVQVLQGAAVVHQALGVGSGPALAYVPTADLPSGALTAKVRATAAGLVGAYSAAIAFTVDRPPVVGAFSAPPATTAARRPPITFATSDPDGNPITAFDLQVYATAGGVATGAPVYAVASVVAGIAAGSVTHTPTVDLPGGPLVIRARVQSGPGALWSAWSADYPFTVALNAPTVVWLSPPDASGWVAPDAPDLANLALPLGEVPVWQRVQDTPPAGQTITREARGVGRGADGTTWAYDGPPQAPNTPAGGTAQQAHWIAVPPTTPYGNGHFRFLIGASGAGQTDTQRRWRASLAEWFGSVALGDSVSELSAVLAAVGGASAGWMRAQSSPSAAAGGAPWRPLTDAAAVMAELPATNAYLGLRARFAMTAHDIDVLAGIGSFSGATLAESGWHGINTASAYQEDGHATFWGDGVGQAMIATAAWPQIVGGASYSFAARVGQAAGAAVAMAVQVAWFDAAGAMVGSGVAVITGAAPVWPSPWGGSLVAPVTATQMVVYVVSASTPTPTGVALFVDDVSAVGPIPGSFGLDKWLIDWRSLG